jgi:hypothetical protein
MLFYGNSASIYVAMATANFSNNKKLSNLVLFLDNACWFAVTGVVHSGAVPFIAFFLHIRSTYVFRNDVMDNI